MKKFLFMFVGVCLASPLIALTSGAQTSSLNADRQSLHEARAHYRAAVQTHGAHSTEALDARTQLRASRHTFHAHRRAIQKS